MLSRRSVKCKSNFASEVISCCQKIAKAVCTTLYRLTAPTFLTKRTHIRTIQVTICYLTPDNYCNLGNKSAVKWAPASQEKTSLSLIQNPFCSLMNVNHENWKTGRIFFLKTGLKLIHTRFPDVGTRLICETTGSTHFIQKSESDEKCRKKQESLKIEVLQKCRKLSLGPKNL